MSSKAVPSSCQEDDSPLSPSPDMDSWPPAGEVRVVSASRSKSPPKEVTPPAKVAGHKTPAKTPAKGMSPPSTPSKPKARSGDKRSGSSRGSSKESPPAKVLKGPNMSSPATSISGESSYTSSSASISPSTLPLTPVPSPTEQVVRFFDPVLLGSSSQADSRLGAQAEPVQREGPEVEREGPEVEVVAEVVARAGTPPAGGTRQPRSDLQYQYTPAHSVMVKKGAVRVFIKRSSGGLLAMNQPTVLYAFAREGGNYSISEVRGVLEKQGLSMYAPEAMGPDSGPVEFGAMVDYWYPIDHRDYIKHGKPEVVITGEILTFGDLVWRLYELGILDTADSVSYNAHREKAGFTTARALMASQAPGPGVVAAAHYSDDLGSDFGSEGDRAVGEVEEEQLLSRKRAEEVDEVRRIAAESGWDEQEPEVTGPTVDKDKYNNLVKTSNGQAKFISRCLKTIDSLTERNDNYVKGDAKLTNQKMAVVVQASMEPLMKGIAEVKKGLQDLRMEGNNQTVNFVRNTSKKNDDQIAALRGQLQQVHNTVRTLLPSPASTPVVKLQAPPAGPPPSFPPPSPAQGQAFTSQGYQPGGGSAPTVFPGPPPTYSSSPFSQGPTNFNQAPNSFSQGPNTFNQAPGPQAFNQNLNNFNPALNPFHPNGQVIYHPMANQGGPSNFYQVIGIES